MRHLLIILTILLLSLSSCTTQNTQVTNQIVENKPLIGISMSGYQEERWLKDKAYLEEYASELGADVILKSSNNDVQIQKNEIENLILQGVDVLIIVPQVADSLANLTKLASEKGIMVISYDRLMTDTYVDLYISFDNEEVGRLEAQVVLNNAKPGKVAYIGGSITDNNALLLRKGSLEVLEPYIQNGTYEIVVDQFSDQWKPESAYEHLFNYLTENGTDIVGVIAANDGTAFGSIQALEKFGLNGKIPVSGQDADLTACQRIIQGTQTGTVYKPIKELARETIKIAIQMAKDEYYQIDTYLDNKLMQVPSRLLKPTLVTKENIDKTIIADGFHSREDVYKEE
ncbi:substrate-binding domain-containing protein [Candidatus Woesearchaeota archaeon]|nr:substrate-binding domain-containing protein [Candidatus Woesearchaeota archaeon]